MEDYSFSGAGTLRSGEYGSIKISGSCAADGNIKCEKISVAGAMHGDASIECKGEVKFSGSVHIGNINADGIIVSGSLEADDIGGGELNLSGSARIKNIVKCNTLDVSGGFSAAAIEAERVTISAKSAVSGLLNAGKVFIRNGKCEIDSIGCSEIEVVSDAIADTKSVNWFKRQWHKITSKCNKNTAVLITESIEGDKISLQNTKAKIVRGDTVVIGKGCEIDEVEYATLLTVDLDAKVNKSTKI